MAKKKKSPSRARMLAAKIMDGYQATVDEIKYLASSVVGKGKKKKKAKAAGRKKGGKKKTKKKS